MPYEIVTIGSKKFDKDLLDKAAELVVGKGDGRISKADAVKLFARAMDAGRLTSTELDTIDYIKKTFNFTGAGNRLLDFLIDQATGADKKSSVDVMIDQLKK